MINILDTRPTFCHSRPNRDSRVRVHWLDDTTGTPRTAFSGVVEAHPADENNILVTLDSGTRVEVPWKSCSEHGSWNAPAAPPVVHDYPEIRYAVVGQLFSMRMEFNIYKVQSLYEGGTIVYESEDCLGADAIEDAEIQFHGAVKWDGCTNWNLMASDCMFHTCSPEQFQHLADVLRHCYDIAKETIPSFLE